MYVLTVQGSAFLWHQVRCMVQVLFLVGQNLEEPKVIDELLDIDKNPGKPQYEIASEIPLVLCECGYDDLKWKYEIGKNISNCFLLVRASSNFA